MTADVRRAGRRGAAVTLAGLVCVAACGTPPGGWAPGVLGAYSLELGELADAPPYFLPTADGLTLFLCRWETATPIPVSLPDGPAGWERDVMHAALAGWENAGLGIRFVEVPPERARVRVEFADLEPGAGSGDTVADCELPRDLTDAAPERQVDARLVRASIRLHRQRYDPLGRVVALRRDELAGAMLHELGHALGYPGHASRGSSIMVREVETVRGWGGRVLGGDSFEDVSLQALYALPPGVVVGALQVPAGWLGAVHALASRAQEEGWRGPWVRVGESSARLFWRRGGDPVGEVDLPSWPETLRDPERFGASIPD